MDEFEKTIKEYLDERAKQDAAFATKYANPKKSIAECCRYIVGEASGMRKGNTAIIRDDEVFGMAVHYYDEENIKIKSTKGMAASVRTENKIEKEDAKIELTKEEQEQARKMALERAIEEQRKRMTERKPKVKPAAEEPAQMSLF